MPSAQLLYNVHFGDVHVGGAAKGFAPPSSAVAPPAGYQAAKFSRLHMPPANPAEEWSSQVCAPGGPTSAYGAPLGFSPPVQSTGVPRFGGNAGTTSSRPPSPMVGIVYEPPYMPPPSPSSAGFTHHFSGDHSLLPSAPPPPPSASSGTAALALPEASSSRRSSSSHSYTSNTKSSRDASDHTVGVYNADFTDILSIPDGQIVHRPHPSFGVSRLVLCRSFVVGKPNSCTKGELCKFVHADTTGAARSSIHVNYAWRELQLCTYPRLPPGEELSVLAPNERPPRETIPSERILVTRGSLSWHEHHLALSHCAHYYFNRMCNRGERCCFIHAAHVDPGVLGDYKRAPAPSTVPPIVAKSSGVRFAAGSEEGGGFAYTAAQPAPAVQQPANSSGSPMYMLVNPGAPGQPNLYPVPPPTLSASQSPPTSIALGATNISPGAGSVDGQSYCNSLAVGYSGVHPNNGYFLVLSPSPSPGSRSPVSPLSPSSQSPANWTFFADLESSPWSPSSV